MEFKKDAIIRASSLLRRYLSCNTSSSGQKRSLWIWRSSPKGKSVTRSLRGVEASTFAIEEFATVFACKGHALGKLAHQLDDLSNVVVVLRIPRS